MARTLTAGMQTAVAAENGEIIHFIELQFSGGTQRISTGVVTMSWDSQTWTAIGGALTINAVTESPDLSASSIGVTLSGVDQTILNVLLTENYIGRVAKVWMVHLSSGAVIADPLLLFSGFMDGGWSIKETRGQSGTVTITSQLVSRLSRLDLMRGIQTNVTSHQAIYPGDRFFEHVNTLARTPIIWRVP
jgi:hypothetical protein